MAQFCRLEGMAASGGRHLRVIGVTHPVSYEYDTFGRRTAMSTNNAVATAYLANAPHQYTNIL